MGGCSKRRKTKHPYCEDDPRCYWNKYSQTCKKKKMKKDLSMKNNVKLSKLDIILKKLNTIEEVLLYLRKKKSKNKNSRRTRNTTRTIKNLVHL